MLNGDHMLDMKTGSVVWQVTVFAALPCSLTYDVA